VILPISWAYGAALFVYEDGCLEWTGITSLSPTYITNSGPAGLDWTIPLFTLTIMLGLALDPWWMKSRGDFSIFHHETWAIQYHQTYWIHMGHMGIIE
jgi:hypothetical protein